MELNLFSMNGSGGMEMLIMYSINRIRVGKWTDAFSMIVIFDDLKNDISIGNKHRQCQD